MPNSLYIYMYKYIHFHVTNIIAMNCYWISFINNSFSILFWKKCGFMQKSSKWQKMHRNFNCLFSFVLLIQAKYILKETQQSNRENFVGRCRPLESYWVSQCFGSRCSMPWSNGTGIPYRVQSIEIKELPIVKWALMLGLQDEFSNIHVLHPPSYSNHQHVLN